MEKLGLKKRAGVPTVLRARVQTRDGRTLVNARVYYVEAPVDIPEIAALTDDEGEVLLAAPEAGLYRLGCSVDGYRNQTVQVTIIDEAEIQVDVVLEPED